MGDDANGSWSSRELGAFIRREESRAHWEKTKGKHLCSACGKEFACIQAVCLLDYASPSLLCGECYQKESKT